MFIVGLTGGIGSGKSTVADLFVARGAALVDTDAIAHDITGPQGIAIPLLRERFGDGILRPDGALDRPAMRQRVFSDPASRRALEAILHPLIRAESDRLCQAAQAPYVILAVPLLVESGGYRDRCDRILVIDCDPAVQVARVMQRSGLGEDEVRAILAAQASREQRLAAADDVIDNGGAQEMLAPQVEALHRRYLEFSKSP